MGGMVAVDTRALQGEPLNWAVAKAEGELIYIADPEYGNGYRTFVERGLRTIRFKPSTDWAQGGLLIEEYGVMLSPPKTLDHYNGGPKAGWSESGCWGTTIFGRERANRRACFSHETLPLVAAMRAVVQFVLGDTVMVPAELVDVVIQKVKE